MTPSTWLWPAYAAAARASAAGHAVTRQRRAAVHPVTLAMVTVGDIIRTVAVQTTLTGVG